MTFEEAQAEYDEPTNPRWICCHAALGVRPKPHQFMIWNSTQLRTFLDSKGYRGNFTDYQVDAGADFAHAEYDSWLVERVNSLDAAAKAMRANPQPSCRVCGLGDVLEDGGCTTYGCERNDE